MNDIEARLIKLEEGMMARMGNMESAIKKLTDAVETLIEIRIHNENNSKEVAKLREAYHDHANALQELPHLREKIQNIVYKLDKLETKVHDLQDDEKTHKFTDNVVSKMLWAGFGFSIYIIIQSIWIMVKKVGIV